MFAWLKPYMPRSLYGRAALILILPIVTLQLAISVVFIQRHFDGVTRQMTRAIGLEIDHLRDVMNAAASPEAAIEAAAPLAEALQFDVDWAMAELEEARVWYDFSGLSLRAALREGRPEIGAIDTAANSRRVLVKLSTTPGDVLIAFDRRRVSASNPHQLLVLMVFLGALMTLIAYIFLRNQLRPIKRLAAAAQAFGRGDVVRYKPSGASEVRSAGLAFLSMRARIERQAAQRTLMLSGVSHDLRTPLTRLKLGLSLIDDDTDALERDVDEMERMVGAFLNFAAEDANETPEPLDLPTFLQMLHDDCQRAGQDVALAPVPQIDLRARPLALRRAVENLIGNAVRYGGRARLSAERGERNVKIVVEDPGPGIAPEEREEALKAFARLEPGRNQNKGSGVGLGLAIAADISRMHGGALSLGESAELGGLRAEILLPL
ncbi:MAG: ATP-binding protein [Pseudomonadota bacterium]